MPRWQMKWPPIRRETYEDVERDIELAEAGRQAYRRQVTPSKDIVRPYGSEETGRSMRAQFRKDLDDAFTEEERMKVGQHWIMKLMHGGRTRRVAEREVLRMLEELQEGVY